ncbi:MAG: MBL fold metallo-hydrolase [Rhodobacter sp.]|nr:MBL fold metallo-hydrolase [Rhodobacter sp.]
MLRLLTACLVLAAGLAQAQDQTRRPSHCIAIADAAPGMAYLHKASYAAPVPDFSVRITYIDHAMFLIQTPGGLSAITDYAGYIGAQDFVPDVVTMNHAHDTHWTPYPNEAIPHVLKGWGPTERGIEHHLDLGEMLIRNVSTDIRSPFDGLREKNGNSIFVFEAEGLCIGHLGHLHHEPNAAQYAALGRLDVVMAAVDGGLTLPTPVIVKILKRLRSSVVIPMHWFGRSSLDRFLVEMGDEFDIRRPGASDYVVSLRTLPNRPTVIVLEPRYLPVFDD